MPFTMRKRLKVWPFQFNYTEHGLSSWSFKPTRRISWNSRTRKWSFDIPGPVNYRTKGRRRR